MANCQRTTRRRRDEEIAAAVRRAAREALITRETMEEDVPMRRYRSPGAVAGGTPVCALRSGGEERALLEQLTVLAGERNQLLCDLLGAVNSLTAVMLCRRGEDRGETKEAGESGPCE